MVNSQRSRVNNPRVHELKADVLFPIFKGVNFTYEFVPARRFGIEASLRYQWGLKGYAYYFNGRDFFAENYFKQQTTSVLITAKYYLSAKQNGTGWYAGAYYRSDQWASKYRDELQSRLPIVTYFELYDNGLNYYYSGALYKRNLRIGIGILAGYKHCFGQHFVLDISMGGDVNLYALYDNDYDYTYLDLFGLPSVKVGYRL